MKEKYMSKDSRTGFVEGEIVELTLEELGKIPFNVYLEKVSDVKDKKKIEEAEKNGEKEDLRQLLLDKGLSVLRTDKVVTKFENHDNLVKNADNAGIDEVTDKFIKDEFGKPVKKEKSKKDGDK